MDLTPSQPVAPGDEPLDEPPAQTADVDAHAASTGPGAIHPGYSGYAGYEGHAVEPRSQLHSQSQTQTRPQPHSQPRKRSHEVGTASRSSREIGGKKFRVGTADDYVPFRRRAKRRRRVITAVVVGLVLVGAGAYGVGSLFGSPSQSSTAGGCPARAGAAPNAAAAAGAGGALAVTAAGQPQLPTAAQIKVNVYNSTNRHGLAAATAASLKKRGFTIGSVTNDPLKSNLTAAAEVRGASANALAMRVVAAEVVGAQLRLDSRADKSVDLVLGAGFAALASPDQVSAALKQAQQAALSPQAQAQAQAAPQKAGSKCS